MNRADAALAAALLSVALYVLYETSTYPDSLIPGAPGPAFFPRLVVGLLIVLTAWLLVSALRGDRTGSAAVTVVESLGGGARVFIAAGLLVAFIAFMERMDLFLALPVLLAGVMLVMGERRPGRLVVVPLAFDVFVYVVFYRIFEVALPTYVF